MDEVVISKAKNIPIPDSKFRSEFLDLVKGYLGRRCLNSLPSNSFHDKRSPATRIFLTSDIIKKWLKKVYRFFKKNLNNYHPERDHWESATKRDRYICLRETRQSSKIRLTDQLHILPLLFVQSCSCRSPNPLVNHSRIPYRDTAASLSAHQPRQPELPSNIHQSRWPERVTSICDNRLDPRGHRGSSGGRGEFLYSCESSSCVPPLHVHQTYISGKRTVGRNK